MPPTAGTARAPIKRPGRPAQSKLSVINDAANELTQVILKIVPAGAIQSHAVRLIADAVSVATSGLMYNGS